MKRAAAALAALSLIYSLPADAADGIKMDKLTNAKPLREAAINKCAYSSGFGLTKIPTREDQTVEFCVQDVDPAAPETMIPQAIRFSYTFSFSW